MAKTKIALLYERLSRDDELQSLSMSVTERAVSKPPRRWKSISILSASTFLPYSGKWN